MGLDFDLCHKGFKLVKPPFHHGITCVSFDLDGTLASEDFDNIIWNTEIPRLYAETHGVPLDDAKTKVYAEYYKALYIEKVKNWTDIDMWFMRLGLSDYQKMMNDLHHMIKLYDDSVPVLEELRKTHKLIIISSAEKKFFDMKLEATGLRQYFDKVYSAPTDFGTWKKDEETFRGVLEDLQLKPEEVAHVGNELKHDYQQPMHVGIRSFLLDRSGGSTGEHIIHSLSELKGKLS